MKSLSKRSCFLATSLATLLTPSAVLGGNVPYLVKDIKPGPLGSSPSFLSSVGGRLFFNADDGVHGQELWVTDGTEAGTYLVIDLVPGPDGSVPQRHMADLQNAAVFYADNNDDGFDLYRSDGTASGTTWLGEVNDGDDPIPDGSCTFRLYHMHTAEGMVYFTGVSPSNIEALWKSDGTPQGTVKLKDVRINGMKVVGSTLFFAGSGPAHVIPGYDLWKSDGTTEGTVRLKDLGGCLWLTASNGLVFFQGEDPQGDDELWVSDGTPEGTIRPLDINPGPNPSTPVELTDVNGTLYFTAFSPEFGREIWKSDGTEAGTQLLIDLVPGSGSGGAYGLTNVDGILFFARFDSNQGWQLWKSDGTVVGTELVKVIAPPSLSSKNRPDFFASSNGRLFFSGDDGIHGEELWVSNGFEWGTRMVADISAGAESSYPMDFTSVGPILFYFAGGHGAGGELWAYDTRQQIPAISVEGFSVLGVGIMIAAAVLIHRNPKQWSSHKEDL
jgi:ELWxxDGT repeat protein